MWRRHAERRLQLQLQPPDHTSCQDSYKLDRLELTLLQFARLESLLKQAGRSPGRQTWTQVGEDQVRAATGAHQLSLTQAHVLMLLSPPAVVHILRLVRRNPFFFGKKGSR